MKPLIVPRPDPSEYSPFTQAYIDRVPPNKAIDVLLADGLAAMQSLIRSLPESKHEYRYAPGKWTIKEILVHVMDTERIFSYRALRIARGDTTPLPGYEQDDYTPASLANTRPMNDILEDYETLRKSTIALFTSFDPSVYGYRGTASNHGLSVRGAMYQVVGHELHHLWVLKERYV